METKITESKLKADCTPEIIKRMVELAEGFKVDTDGTFYNGTIFPNGMEIKFDIQNDELLFPLLIHRAVEGFNKDGVLTIYTDYCSAMIYGRTALSYRSRFLFNDYHPESLTPCECACLHCLIEVLK